MGVVLDNSLGDASLLALLTGVSGLLTDLVLVSCRLVGLLVTMPGFHVACVPWQLRCLLLIVLATVIAPNVSRSTDAQIPRSKVEVAATEVEESLIQLSHAETQPVARQTLSDLAILSLCELMLGCLLGVGTNLILQGFRMAGQLIDQQTGLGLTSGTGIDGEEASSISGELLFWIGSALLFVLGGHLLLISTLIDTFCAIPPGHYVLDEGLIPLGGHLLQQACGVALRLAAPILAVQTLVSLCLAYAGSASPNFAQGGTGPLVRFIVSLGVLILALSGTTELLLELIPQSVQLGLPMN